MLGKLLKHELKATGRLLLPLFLILAVLTVMNRIVSYLDIFKGVLSVIPGLIIFAYTISIIAVFVVTSVLIIYRFYKNLMTDEGYLMFTLPAKTRELIDSKLIISFLWSLVSIAAVILSLIVVFSGYSYYPDMKHALAMLFRELASSLGNYATLFYVELIVMTLLSIINSTLMIYVSIAIGQLINGHKIIGSIGAYIGLSTVLQVLSVALMAIANLAFGNTFQDITSVPRIIFPFSLAFQLVTSIAFYLGTDFLFKRKLNLE
ncbi:MAG TPA: hypothetical protein GXX75_08715 [Clostridiales bacterium]|nr:hypothetical protein [Clostridiales bacterium]